MSYFECNCFERKLAFHTAPALLGIKAASLFSVNDDEFSENEISEFNKRADRKHLKLCEICRCKKRRLMLLFNQKALDDNLHSNENISLLEKYGYSKDMSTSDMLDRLSQRISESDSFPHEIGIFLGYPFEDVKGFIVNGGTNYKLCGYWKVYGDENKAKRIFDNYDKCRRFLCNKLISGADIYQALKIA